MTIRTTDNNLNAISAATSPSRSVRRARARRGYAAMNVRTIGTYGAMTLHGSTDTYQEIL
ncbi:hypothetical protein GCM10009069_22720 [Algimonas arctica]|uniref:Uncharacterized protein n=1 Tax=Algimonas arctica TaxID=1479486 RepID=A0A8J3CT72_9PROT|nr:hypothetical protein [Algimonas arctica]GHA99395.1 hypothetical protein GCM10009069_22720 [Algimonas arctica]